MSLPPRALYSLAEVAARWGCTIADIVEWGFAGHLEIVVAIPPTSFGGQLFTDMVAVAPSDVLRMCRRCGTGPDEIRILRVRPPGGDVWSVVQPPELGVIIDRKDLAMTSEGLAGFEDRYTVSRRSSAVPTARYDWEAFYTALMIRIHENGLPGSMTELVGEMQDWFVRHSADGEAPDESTIRKRISPIWHRLRAALPA